MRPPSTTRIWSAPRTVDSRWAMTSAVRPGQRGVEGPLDGDLGLAVEVGGGLVEDDEAGALSSSRAIARRCFSPPESRWPRSPTTVSRPSGRRATRSQIWAAAQRLHQLAPRWRPGWRRAGWPGSCRGTGARPGSPRRRRRAARPADVAQVEAAEPDAAAGRVVEPGDEAVIVVLPAPRRADQGDQLARRGRGR